MRARRVVNEIARLLSSPRTHTSPSPQFHTHTYTHTTPPTPIIPNPYTTYLPIPGFGMAGDDGTGSQVGARVGRKPNGLPSVKEQRQGELARGRDEARVGKVNLALRVHHTQGARHHHVRIAGVSNAGRAGQRLHFGPGRHQAASGQQCHEGQAECSTAAVHPLCYGLARGVICVVVMAWMDSVCEQEWE